MQRFSAEIESFAKEFPHLCPTIFIFGIEQSCKIAYNTLQERIDENHKLFMSQTHKSCQTVHEKNAHNYEEQDDHRLNSFNVLTKISNSTTIAASLVNSEFNVITSACQVTSPQLIYWDSKYANMYDFVKPIPGVTVYGHTFPQEKYLTEKDLLCKLIQDTIGTASWYCTTYRVGAPISCVSTPWYNQLEAFLGHWLTQEMLDPSSNYWIIKPAASSRSRNIFVGRDLSTILDHLRKVLQIMPIAVISRYISSPMLFKGRKFDLRIFFALKSVRPLELYVYDGILMRHAPQKYDLDNLDDLVHLTVLQYRGISLPEPDSMADMESWYLETHGKSLYGAENLIDHIHRAFKELFQVATCQHETDSGDVLGLLDEVRGRALYGADVLIETSGCPKILELNFKPDLTRIIAQRPDFLKQTMRLLYGDASKQVSTSASFDPPTDKGEFRKI